METGGAAIIWLKQDCYDRINYQHKCVAKDPIQMSNCCRISAYIVFAFHTKFHFPQLLTLCKNPASSSELDTWSLRRLSQERLRFLFLIL